MWLKLKISIGYGILMLLLIFTVHFFRRKQSLMDTLRKGEETLSRIRNLTEKTYTGLLDLTSQAELVAVWEEEELDEYGSVVILGGLTLADSRLCIHIS